MPFSSPFSHFSPPPPTTVSYSGVPLQVRRGILLPPPPPTRTHILFLSTLASQGGPAGIPIGGLLHGQLHPVHPPPHPPIAIAIAPPPLPLLPSPTALLPEAARGSLLARQLKTAISLFMTSRREGDGGAGVLAMVWMPLLDAATGKITLQTRNLPYMINGVGDELATFRAASIIFSFATDPAEGNLGIPGRVYTTRVSERERQE